MGETSDQLRNVLERIRDDSQEALNLLASTADQVSSENINAAWASVCCIAGG